MEYCTDEQRTMIVDQVADQIVNIALNIHGTRAVQKMIEFVDIPPQVGEEHRGLLGSMLRSNRIGRRCRSTGLWLHLRQTS